MSNHQELVLDWFDEEMKKNENQLNQDDPVKEYEEHIVLLGDSILDNESYISSWNHSSMFDANNNINTQVYDDVLQQLKSKIIKLNWCATNCAVDGAITDDVLKEQLKTIPNTVTTIVLSCGGNDGLESLSDLTLDRKNWLPWNFLKLLYDTRQTFKRNYCLVLESIKKKYPNVKIICCTIYYPVFDDEFFIQIVSNIGINIMSSVIIDCARQRNYPIIDLRHVFDKKYDYANSIEPGIPGGDKMTNNIVHIVENHDFNTRHNKKKDLIYKLKTYTNGMKPENYGTFYWQPQDNEEQNGNAATKFFRRAFNDGKNRSICCSCKVICAVIIIVIIALCVLGAMDII